MGGSNDRDRGTVHDTQAGAALSGEYGGRSAAQPAVHAMNRRVSLRSTRPTWICSQKPLAAFGVVAAGALIAAFEADQRRFAAFRALPEARSARGAAARSVPRLRGRV